MGREYRGSRGSSSGSENKVLELAENKVLELAGGEQGEAVVIVIG